MMKKRFIRIFKWLAVFVVFAALTVFSFLYEKDNSSKFRLTAGAGAISVLSFVAAVWTLFDKNIGKISTMIVEDVFGIKRRGCVVVGLVNGGMAVGERVTICCKYGGEIKARINGIEIDRKRARAAVDTHAALYFKRVEADKVYKGDVIRYES